MMNALLALVFILVATGLCLISHRLMRLWAGRGGRQITPAADLASGARSQIAALHGLILALVFAQELVNYEQLKSETAVEANAIADIYFDAERFGGEDADEIQDALFIYVKTVLDAEWAGLGETGQLSPVAWAQWNTAYETVLDLKAASPRQESLRDHMLGQIHVIASARDSRQNHKANATNLMFWMATIAGLILIAAAYHHHPPDRQNLAFLVMIGVYTGLVLFFIYAFGNPFSEPAAMDPHAFRSLEQQLAAARK